MNVDVNTAMLELEVLMERWRREAESREAIRCGGYVPPSKADIARAFNCAESHPAVDAVYLMFKPYMDRLASHEAWWREPKYEARFNQGNPN